jgi:DNA-binding response OmpR family regulator
MTEHLTAPRRFLVVEDEAMIALLLEDYLADLGHSMAWHADTVEAAVRLAVHETDIDGAILDVNLHGQTIDPVVAALTARGVPFCFMTGLGNGAIAGFPDAPVVGKPFDIEALRRAIDRLRLPT